MGKMKTRVQCFKEDDGEILTQKINYFFYTLETWPEWEETSKIVPTTARRVPKYTVHPEWEIIDIKYTIDPDDGMHCAMVIFKANFDMFDMVNQSLNEKI